MRASSPPVPWHDIDTVMLDMDGTLLDLAFDNFFWLELVPSEYARVTGLPEHTARAEIAQRYARVAGSLPWYCLDHWSRELGLDIRALKWRHRHLVRYLPMVPEFLRVMRGQGKRMLLVTNAHREAVAVKVAVTRLDVFFDELISSHDLNEPKESHAFWPKLRDQLGFDPARSLLVEDSLAVLEAARAFGVRHTVAVSAPDSRRPPHRVEGFLAVGSVAELLPDGL